MENKTFCEQSSLAAEDRGARATLEYLQFCQNVCKRKAFNNHYCIFLNQGKQKQN